MHINITGRHVTVTDNIRKHVDEKMERCLKIFPKLEKAHVVLEQEKYIHRAEVNVWGAHHLHVVAKEESENLYDAIDRAIEHVERQLHRHFDKLKEHHH